MKRGYAIIIVKSLFTVVFLISFNSPILGQDVLIDSGDELDLVVPMRDELSRRITVDEKGDVSLPIIGKVKIKGLNIDEASSLLLSKLREVYPSVTTIELHFISKESRPIIYVHGQVLNPGKYEFTGSSPNVWEAIREAGGALANASLESVILIRSDNKGKRTTYINLQNSIDTGDFSRLPILKPGDTVIIPEDSPQYRGSGAIRIIGAVINPASYSISSIAEGNRTLADALLTAGGPTDNADLRKVKIIRALPDGGTKTIQVDFNRYLEKGDLNHNPMIKKGDTVSVPKRSNPFMDMFTDPRFIIGLLTTTTTIIAITLR